VLYCGRPMSTPRTEFPCTKCGACCRSVGSVLAILTGGVIRPGRDGVCGHLTPDNQCNIYESRPLLCRVNSMRPPLLPLRKWHEVNLRMCDRLHLRVYGVPRPAEAQ